MPNILDDIVSVFIDDYTDAARKTSNMPVVFLDPNKFDMKAIDAAAKNVDATKPETIANFQTILADQVRSQMEKQTPGISDGMSNSDLAALGGASLTQGLFALRGESLGKNVCFINKPKGDEADKTAFFVAITGMDKKKVGDIPGWQDHWERAWGIHEGAHCNQNRIDLTRGDVDLQRLRNETASDRATIKWMRDNKLDDMAQTFIDLRSINAFMGDDHHATTPFLKAGDTTEPTQAHFDAAQQLRQTVMRDVGKELGLNHADTDKLFRDDPRKFLDTVDKMLKEGKIGNTRPATFEERTNALAKELGVDPVDVYSVDGEVFGKAFDKLEKEGAFTKPQDNPHVKEYIKSFAEAYRRQVVDRPEPVAPKRKFGPRADASGLDDGDVQLASAEDAVEEDGVEEEVVEVAEADEVSEEEYEVAAAEEDVEIEIVAEADVVEEEVPAQPVKMASAAKGFGHYDYLATKEIGKGEPIIVHNDVHTEMKIGGVAPREFFAVQADPALAEQRLEAQGHVSTPSVAQENTKRYTAAVLT